METNLDKRYQTLIILWFPLLMSIVMYFVVTLFVTPGLTVGPRSSARSFLIVGLTALGTFLVVISFIVKGRLLERSVQNQDLNLVQKALIIAWAMCEFSALLGLLEYFVVGNREYYLLFLLAAGGIALHFPRRSQLEAASYKSSAQLS